MKVKELDRTVNVAWSPASHHPILMAAGTAAQQLDSSFSTTSALEIYSLNISEPGLDMDLIASTPSDFRFHKIAWNTNKSESGLNPGVIVGGCDGGRLQLYSVAKLLSGEDGLVVSQEKHTGPVRTLDFNPFQSNLLATAASESEIFIWDLNSMATPMTPGAKVQPPEDVVWISWNRQVQPILASTFSQRCVVLDLRKNEPVIKLSDSSSRIRWKVIAWHPDVATQLCLASEEDQTPVIQLWDLRFATSPLKVLENHQRGVLSIAWCSQDPDLLASCGKDNRILCWNPNSNVSGGEVVCDLTTTNQWNFDVSWCPRNPALIASSSFDGHVSVYSLTGGTQQVQTSTKIADSFPGMESYIQAQPPQPQTVVVDLRKPPKWLRKPVGAFFGFGGKLISFGHEIQQQQLQQGGTQQRLIYISQVVTEPELISRSAELETALQYGQYLEFCRNKIASSTTPHERAVWSFLRANFEPNPRVELLELLGFKQDDLNQKLNRFIGKPANARSTAADELSDKLSSLGRENDTDLDAEESEGAQANSVPPDGDASATFDAIAAASVSNGLMATVTPIKPFKIGTADDIDGMVCQSLLLGNIEAAVDLCLEDGRMADAIILAMTGGSDLLARTQYRYFQQSKGYLSNLISAVVTEDWSQVIQSCEVDSWREALAAALTHTKNDELPVLCETLGQRLEKEGKGVLQLNAQLCYICAGSLSKLVENWKTVENPTSPRKLQDLVELVMILQKAIEQQGRNADISGALAEFLTNYAEILASQGNLNAALTYLGNSEEEHIAMLRDRLLHSLGHKQVTQPQVQQPAMLKTQLTGKVVSSSRRSSGNAYPSHSTHPLQTSSMGQIFPGSAVQVSNQYGSHQPSPTFHSNQSHTYPPVVPPSVHPYTPQGAAVHSPLPPSPYNVSSPSQYSTPGMPPKTYSPAPPPVNPVQPFSSQGVGQLQHSPAPSAAAPLVSQGSVRSYSPADLSMYQKLWETTYPVNVPRWSGIPASRSKPYVLDPSVQSGHLGSFGMQPSYGGSQHLYPSSPAMPSVPQAPVAPADIYNPQEPVSSPTVFNTVQAPPGIPNNAPSGWNDPPLLRNAARTQFEQCQMSAVHAGTRKWSNIMTHMQPKPEYVSQGPITHPLYGNAQPDMNNMGINGVYLDPSNQQQFPQQTYQQQQVQHTPAVQPAKVVDLPKPKGPLPEEYMYLQTVFDELRNRCTMAANNPQSKRKLEDVARKLEALYDAIRDNKLSPTTLSGLQQMVQMVQIGNYTSGLELHTQLVSGPDFSQIASFMPGLKVLLQSALQLGVYLQ